MLIIDTTKLSFFFLFFSGEYTAYELAKRNCKLILSGTNLARLDAVRTKCLSLMTNRSDDDILVLPFNLTKFDLHKDVLTKALNHFEKVYNFSIDSTLFFNQLKFVSDRYSY